jgi:hypothetical protein
MSSILEKEYDLELQNPLLGGVLRLRSRVGQTILKDYARNYLYLIAKRVFNTFIPLDDILNNQVGG